MGNGGSSGGADYGGADFGHPDPHGGGLGPGGYGGGVFGQDSTGRPDVGNQGGPDFGSGTGSLRPTERPPIMPQPPPFQIDPNQVRLDMENAFWNKTQTTPEMSPVEYQNSVRSSQGRLVFNPSSYASSPFSPAQMDWSGFFNLFGGK